MRALRTLLVAVVLVLLSPAAAQAHRIDFIIAKWRAENALMAYGNNGINWAANWANAGEHYPAGVHSWYFYGKPGLGRTQYTVPPAYYTYHSIVHVQHETITYLDVYNKVRQR